MNYDPKENKIYVDETSGSFTRGSGQLFVKILKEVADQPNASNKIKTDWNTLKKWLGCKGNELTPIDYEKISIAWQSYMATHEAPSLELEESFAESKKSAKEENWEIINIPDDVKRIFDRMLATDDKIKKKQDQNKRDLKKSPTTILPDHLDQPVARHLYGVNSTLNEIFRKVLIPKGVSPKVSESLDFPFSNYDDAIAAIKSGRAHLSFSAPSSYAFNAVAKTGERNLHTFLMTLYMLFAPISLIAGAYFTQNYYLLLIAILWLPLAFFGSHPAYRSAPKFLFMALLTIAYGAYFESGSWMVVGTFLFLCIAGYSATRYYYNKIIIKRALEMEKAFMFLLGSNALLLCGNDWSRLWRPKWLKDV